jgi:predicted nuclease with TOPRIM domain
MTNGNIKPLKEANTIESGTLRKMDSLHSIMERYTVTELHDLTIIHMMLRDLFVTNKKSQERYDEIRKLAMSKLHKQFGDTPANELLQLREQAIQSQSNQYEMKKEIEVLKAKNKELCEKYNKLVNKSNQMSKRFEQVVYIFMQYNDLVKWYNRMEKAVPEIRKRNSNWIIEQSWEGAIAEYEHYNKRPEINHWNPDELGLRGNW